MSTYKSDFLNVLNERGFIHQCSDFDGLDALLRNWHELVGLANNAPAV